MNAGGQIHFCCNAVAFFQVNKQQASLYQFTVSQTLAILSALSKIILSILLLFCKTGFPYKI